MNAKSIYPVLFAITALAAACNSDVGGSATPPTDQEAIKSLGSTLPEPTIDRPYWQKQHDANTSVWQKAKRLCEQTVLASYPNCLPVSDLVQADQRLMAEIGNKAAAKNDEMFARGYLYDFNRRSWLPYRQLMAAGCFSVPAYPNDAKRIGFTTWSCPQGTEIPEGIIDPGFRGEEERATD